MSDAFLTVFDAWEPLFKARKAKGLDKWERLRHLSEKLQGKSVQTISYTCCHPSHGGEPVKHILGSVEGNLHFLLGYGNPSFHIADYHWQIIDPNVTDEEAVETASRMRHPSNPVLWDRSGLSASDEGDLEEGTPHEFFSQKKTKEKLDNERKAEAIEVPSGAGSYTAYPSEGIVVGNHNAHTYRWDLVKDTFFSANNPQLTQAMESAQVKKSQGEIVARASISKRLLGYAAQFQAESFEEDVWPLVKSRFPKPGKVLSLESSTGETLYGVITPTELQFFSKSEEPVAVRVFDQEYTTFSLQKSGNVPPVALYSFVKKYFKVDTELLSLATELNKSIVSSEWAVSGEPSPGWESAPAELETT